MALFAQKLSKNLTTDSHLGRFWVKRSYNKDTNHSTTMVKKYPLPKSAHITLLQRSRVLYGFGHPCKEHMYPDPRWPIFQDEGPPTTILNFMANSSCSLAGSAPPPPPPPPPPRPPRSLET